MIARRRLARPSDAPRFRENSPARRVRRLVVSIVLTLWRLRGEIAIAAIVLVVMDRTYQAELADSRSARAQAEADRAGVVELILAMIHKPPGYSVALSAPTPQALADQLSTARHVVLTDSRFPAAQP